MNSTVVITRTDSIVPPRWKVHSHSYCVLGSAACIIDHYLKQLGRPWHAYVVIRIYVFPGSASRVIMSCKYELQLSM